VVPGKLEIHDEKYNGKAWTVKVREVLEELEKVNQSNSKQELVLEEKNILRKPIVNIQ
jgi:hypothetical protein